MLHPCAGCLLGVAGGEPGSLCRLRPHLLGCYCYCSGFAFCDGSAAGAFMPTKAFPLMRLWRPSNMTFLNGWTTQVGKCTCFTCLWKKPRSTARLASAFLAAVPSGCTRVEPVVFSAKLRFLLGVPHAVHDCWCPLSAGVLDISRPRVPPRGNLCLLEDAVRDVPIRAFRLAIGWTGQVSIPRRSVLVNCHRIENDGIFRNTLARWWFFLSPAYTAAPPHPVGAPGPGSPAADAQ